MVKSRGNGDSQLSHSSQRYALFIVCCKLSHSSQRHEGTEDWVAAQVPLVVFLEARHCSAAARGDISEGRCWRRCSSERRQVHVRSGRAASWQQGDDVVDVILGIDDWVAAQVPLVGSGRAATAVQRRGAASPEGGDAGGDARVSGVRCTPPRKGDILGGEVPRRGVRRGIPEVVPVASEWGGSELGHRTDKGPASG